MKHKEQEAAFASSDHGPGITKLEYVAAQLMYGYVQKGHPPEAAAAQSISAARELIKQIGKAENAANSSPNSN